MGRMPATAEAWAEIRRCHEQTFESHASIARRFGVDRNTIAKRAERDNWAARPVLIRGAARTRKRLPPVACGDGAVLPAGTNRPLPNRQPYEQRPPDAPDVRISRIYRVIDLQLDSLEKEMTSGDPVSAQDHERRARAMHLIIESLEQAKEAAAELLKREQHAGGSTFAEAERVRNDIAARVERMGTRWDTETKA